MEQKPERTYTLGEAAEILGVTSPWLSLEEAARYVRAGDGSTIRAAVRYGDLPAYLYRQAIHAIQEGGSGCLARAAIMGAVTVPKMYPMPEAAALLQVSEDYLRARFRGSHIRCLGAGRESGDDDPADPRRDR